LGFFGALARKVTFVVGQNRFTKRFYIGNLMRIVHWYPNFLNGGAVANAVLGLAKAQARLGANVAIAAAEPLGPPLYEAIDESTSPEIVRWCPRRTFRLGNMVLRQMPSIAIRRVQEFHSDIVHVHGEFNPDNWWAPRLFKCPIILSPHGAFHPVVFVKSRRTMKRIYFHVAQQFLYQHVTAFHALCPMEYEHIVELLPGSEVYCLPQGPNIQTQQSVAVHEQKQTDGGVNLIFVGRLDIFTKGLDILLDAFARAAKYLSGRHLFLNLVGPDWHGTQAELRQHAQALGIADRVFFLGPSSGQQVAAALNASDVYIQLSRHEGFPLSIAEGLLANKPAILSSSIGTVSYPEVCRLPHVRIVPPNVREAVVAIIEFVQNLDPIKTLAKQYEEEIRGFFSWERIAGMHLEMYERLKSRAFQGAKRMSGENTLYPDSLI
jgi:glycosyltransferase involved in cell wall biosynthesis